MDKQLLEQRLLRISKDIYKVFRKEHATFDEVNASFGLVQNAYAALKSREELFIPELEEQKKPQKKASTKDVLPAYGGKK